MRWAKYLFFSLILFFGIYAASMSFVKDSTQISYSRTVPYGLEKLYPQFSDLQKLSGWVALFSDKNTTLEVFSPYEGQGSSLVFKNKKDQSEGGEVYLKYANPGKALRYFLYPKGEASPYIIEIVFKKNNAESSTVQWLVHTPKIPLLARYKTLLSKDAATKIIEESMTNLVASMGNKVDREGILAKIKVDSLMVENLPAQNLLGINVSTQNKKDGVFKNIILNHNKVKNFVTTDLGKKDDEFGFPLMISDPNNLKDKEISYFYGVPLSKKVGISDNNFSFRSTQGGKAIILYYRGSFEGRNRAIQQLLLKAKKDTLRYSTLQEEFLEEPTEGKDCFLKICLPVYR